MPQTKRVTVAVFRCPGCGTRIRRAQQRTKRVDCPNCPVRGAYKCRHCPANGAAVFAVAGELFGVCERHADRIPAGVEPQSVEYEGGVFLNPNKAIPHDAGTRIIRRGEFGGTHVGGQPPRPRT